ncbi:PspC domain-containing protein [uncultured Shewanella sp.]|uniref:PspC domain-containing protein n=1 Tax=uncultured Shewanella sp. TaxID=173975 RepID=UPI00262E2E70|nr:PspC domain-containing protein [uncultured Shewanella sp.]
MRSTSAKSSNCEAIFCGVVARVSSRFGWSCFWTRIVSGILIVINPLLGLLTYLVLAWLFSKYE